MNTCEGVFISIKNLLTFSAILDYAYANRRGLRETCAWKGNEAAVQVVLEVLHPYLSRSLQFY